MDTPRAPDSEALRDLGHEIMAGVLAAAAHSPILVALISFGLPRPAISSPYANAVPLPPLFRPFRSGAAEIHTN